MVTIINKNTGLSYQVTREKAEEIRNSASGGKFTIPNFSKNVDLPELKDLDKFSENVVTQEENSKDISEVVEETDSNETNTEKPKRSKKSEAKVDQ